MKEPDLRSAQIVEDGAKFLAQGMSTYDQLEDATDEELLAQLRTSDGYTPGRSSDIEDIIYDIL